MAILFHSLSSFAFCSCCTHTVPSLSCTTDTPGLNPIREPDRFSFRRLLPSGPRNAISTMHGLRSMTIATCPSSSPGFPVITRHRSPICHCLSPRILNLGRFRNIRSHQPGVNSCSFPDRFPFDSVSASLSSSSSVTQHFSSLLLVTTRLSFILPGFVLCKTIGGSSGFSESFRRALRRPCLEPARFVVRWC
jgi:hypothetical protein